MGFKKQIDYCEGNSEMGIQVNRHQTTAAKALSALAVNSLEMYLNPTLAAEANPKREKLISNNHNQSFRPFICHIQRE